ncbi:MAG: hypothetical protein WCA16_21030, partial [Candidatus Sulfotelmatobacter sp.]
MTKAESAPAAPPAFKLRPTRQPMLWAAAAYSSGIIFGLYQWRPALWWVVAGVVFLASAAYLVRRRIRLAGALALGAFFLGGALHIQVSSRGAPIDISIGPFTDGQELDITAHVIRDGRLRPGTFGELQQRLDVETDEIVTDNGQHFSVHSGVRLGIYRR